jgi:putative membrane protein
MPKIGFKSLLLGAAAIVPIWLQYRSKRKEGGVSSDDATFLREAAAGGRLEVKLGEIAVNRSATEDVKYFARRMQRDHTRTDDELKDLARKKGVQLPTGLMTKQQSMIDRLAKLSGKEFDRQYMKSMIEDHAEDVAKFEQEAKQARDRDVKHFAKNTTRVLKEHLKLAQKTGEEIGVNA